MSNGIGAEMRASDLCCFGNCFTEDFDLLSPVIRPYWYVKKGIEQTFKSPCVVWRVTDYKTEEFKFEWKQTEWDK
jgi:hypothetical protein